MSHLKKATRINNGRKMTQCHREIRKIPLRAPQREDVVSGTGEITLTEKSTNLEE